MTVNDCEDFEKYDELEQKYFLNLKALAGLNSDNILINITEIINKGLEQIANINYHGFIYRILRVMPLKRSPKSFSKILTNTTFHI